MAGHPIEIIIPAERSQFYRNWIENGARILTKELPFSGPANVAITLGSGLGPVVDYLNLQNRVTIPYQAIGLPIGQVKNHKKELIAGLTDEGKKVIIVNGRTHPYEIPERGIDVKRPFGRSENLSRMELATGYLTILNQIGVEKMILSSAVGGINHPLRIRQLRPFDPEALPVIGLIATDIDEAYSSPQMGPYVGYAKDRFVNLHDADQDLMNDFRESIYKTAGRSTTVPYFHHFTSLSTPSFEGVGEIYDAALRGAEVVGMTFGPEKRYLVGADNIGCFIAVAVVTNSQELVYKNKKPGKTAISVEILRQHHAHEFRLSAIATDEEVKINGEKAADRLGKALTHLIKSV